MFEVMTSPSYYGSCEILSFKRCLLVQTTGSKEEVEGLAEVCCMSLVVVGYVFVAIHNSCHEITEGFKVNKAEAILLGEQMASNC